MYQGKCYYCNWAASPCREREVAKGEMKSHIEKRHLGEVRQEIAVLRRKGKGIPGNSLRGFIGWRAAYCIVKED